MDFEAELAKTLGLGKEKKSAVSQLSIEELEELLRDSVQAIKGPAEVAQAKSKTASISLEMADKWGRELAQKTASIGETVGQLGKSFTKMPAGKRMAIAAGAGAGQDLLMNRDSSPGSVAGKAAISALGSQYAPRGLKALANHDSDFGRAVKRGINHKP